MRLQKILDQKKIKIELDQQARNVLSELGYSDVYGARPLKRIIQQHIQNKLAQMILSGEVLEGQKIVVSSDANNNNIVLNIMDKD